MPYLQFPPHDSLWETFPRCIFGESVRFDTPDGFDTRLFLTYTHLPRFVCELHEYSIPMPIAPDVAGENGCWIGSGRHRAWHSRSGFVARSFIFLEGPPPEATALEIALGNLSRDYWIYCEEYGMK